MIPLECWETTSSSGRFVPVVPGGRFTPLNFRNRVQYCDACIAYRLKEFDDLVVAVREGMAGIIPVPLLSLQTAQRFEQLVCGLPHISIDLLKKVVRYVIEQT